MADQPKGLPNHPAWTLGHLAYTCDFGASVLGMEKSFSEKWMELYQRGSTPLADRQRYLSKKELMEMLEQQHKKLSVAIGNTDPKMLAEPPADENLRQRFANRGGFIFFLMTAHMGMHIGQLADWRRAMGMDRIV